MGHFSKDLDKDLEYLPQIGLGQVFSEEEESVGGEGRHRYEKRFAPQASFLGGCFPPCDDYAATGFATASPFPPGRPPLLRLRFGFLSPSAFSAGFSAFSCFARPFFGPVCLAPPFFGVSLAVLAAAGAGFFPFFFCAFGLAGLVSSFLPFCAGFAFPFFFAGAFLPSFLASGLPASLDFAGPFFFSCLPFFGVSFFFVSFFGLSALAFCVLGASFFFAALGAADFRAVGPAGVASLAPLPAGFASAFFFSAFAFPPFFLPLGASEALDAAAGAPSVAFAAFSAAFFGESSFFFAAFFTGEAPFARPAMIPRPVSGFASLPRIFAFTDSGRASSLKQGCCGGGSEPYAFLMMSRSLAGSNILKSPG